MTEEARDVIRRQTLQDKDAAARQESAVDLERGVLRRRSDQDDAPLLHKWEKRILLRLVEAMDLINKNDDTLPIDAAAIRLLHDRADILNPARHRREVDEFRLRPRGNDAGKRRLANAGWSPEDHRGNVVALDETPQHFPLAEKMLLSDKILEGLRTHALSEGLICSAFKKTPLPIHADAHLPHADSLTMDYRIKKGLRQ